jgi:soluble lytic murein transglycosylase-like protein
LEMMRGLILIATVLFGGAVCADVMVLESGKTMKIRAYEVQGASIHVTINDRSEMVIPVEWVREIRIVPDEPEPQLAAEDIEAIRQFAYSDLILSLSKKHELDWKLVAAVMAVESNFNPRAVSPKGAQGLMQLMPATARLYSVANPYDPIQNVEAGIRHLKMLVTRYAGKLELALAAYNSGEMAVDRYGGIPPYTETKAYVRKVLQLIRGLSA